jgi:hypothetical protein
MDYKIAYVSNSVSEGFPTLVTVSSSASPLLTLAVTPTIPGQPQLVRFRRPRRQSEQKLSYMRLSD